MNPEIELELVAGGGVKLMLPPPGDCASFYVFSTEYCGNSQFWQLLTRLMDAAGRPLCAIHNLLRARGLYQRDVTPASMHKLLRLPGYGFGFLYNFNSSLFDVMGAESQKILFLRDPRDLLTTSYGHSMQATDAVPMPFDEFLKQPAVERLEVRYKRYAELRYQGSNVTLFRYEHAIANWRAIAAELVATLKLPVKPEEAAFIAESTKDIGDRLAAGAEVSGAIDNAETDARFADVLAAFGYAPRKRPVVVEDRQAGRVRLGAIFERDPVLQARLKPNTSTEMRVLGRQVVMEVDADGCRPVIGRPSSGEKTLAAFGCSCTYGNAVMAEETFCSQLQEMFPAWRVENHGVPAYCTTQNLIQLEREARWDKPELVTFCWIEHHLRRNVADISWVQDKSEKSRNWAIQASLEDKGQRFPRASLDEHGELSVRSVRFPRYDLAGIDFSDFAPDAYYLDQVCFRLFERANAIVTGYGGHFFVTTLLGRLSAGLAGKLADSGIPVVAASLTGREYTCLPDDGHPNAHAHRIYAERIRDYVLRYKAG